MKSSRTCIQTRHLCREYRVHERGAGMRAALRGMFHPRTKVISAINDVTLDIASGEMVGILGPNGAGKTTLMKMLGCNVAYVLS